jgi:hypothetical protein
MDHRPDSASSIADALRAVATGKDKDIRSDDQTASNNFDIS